MTKGLLFGGCSFTWGQGLYYGYGNIPGYFNTNLNYGYETKGITQGMIDYKNSLRFANLVASHFNTYYVTKEDIGSLLGNGGSEDETFQFFDYLFNVEKKYDYGDFEFVVIQLTNIFRNNFVFQYDGVTYVRKLIDSGLNSHEHIGGKELEKYCIENNLNFDQLQDIFINDMCKRLKDKVNYYEDRGLKIKILCMNSDYVHYIVNDDVLKNKLIKLIYNNKTYYTIDELINDKNYNNLTFECDKIQDRHPSKLCHQIIAQSIINNLENN